MRPEKLLLLDLSPASGAGEQLRAMLETTFQVTVLPLEGEHEGQKSETLCDVVEAVRGFEPSLIFLVLPRTETKRTSPLLQTIFAELNDLPVVVVTETEEPGELFELLRQGVADFVTPPLRAVDLFPRIWHALEQTRREEPWVRKLKEKLGLKQLIGESPAFLAEVQKFPIANVIGTLANQAGSDQNAAEPQQGESVPAYLLGESGEFLVDPAVPEERAQLVLELLNGSLPESDESDESDDYRAAYESFESDESDESDDYWDMIELSEAYADEY